MSDRADRIESEDVVFHARVADAYLHIAGEHPQRFRVIDASGSAEEVHKRVREILDAALDRLEPGRAGPT